MNRRHDSLDNYGNEDSLVLLCVDDREHCLRAFNWFMDHFYRRDHIIGLVHVYSPPEVPSYGKRGSQTSLDQEEEEYRRRVVESESKKKAVIDKFQMFCIQKGLRYCIFTEKKDESVGKTICEVARRHEAACIVMGPRGLGTIKRTIYGSVSEHVLHNARIPLVIVPPQKKQK